ncbi:hypothetical protein [Terriglobus roseus]|uniref:SAF domain-containing protein n=1 Tax=Terriglobus roseus TaxID=392734 RepID=A0A1G7MLR3_9BACT|nr:hypothetical protein [Terriglobus roseus]SDF62647.1 hypothetical protein SAMN05444167_2844 [Terriglobus roseus]
MKRSIALLVMAFAPLLATAQATAPLNAVLMTNVDARKARVGDTIKIRSYSGFVATGGQRVPPGSTLLGHVTEVSKLVKGSADSRLAILFDQAQLASGQTVPIHMGIAGLAAPPPVAGMQDLSSMSAESESPFPGPRSTGTPVDPSGTRSTGPTTGGTDGTRVTRTTVGQINSPNHPNETMPSDHVGGTATVGSSIPGITLQPSPATRSTLVSNSSNITLRIETPLVLLPVAANQ